jgi:hypothetical protein
MKSLYDCVFYRLTNSEPKGRYRLIKHILADPRRSVVLMHTQGQRTEVGERR